MHDPNYFGIYRGIVADTNDPLSRGRIRIKVPQVLGEEITDWAWPAPGTLPGEAVTINSGVFVSFEGGDPNFPIWLGTFSEIFPSRTLVDTPFDIVGGTSGTQPTFSSDPLFSGSYVRVGDQVHFQIQVDMDNITGFGTGQYYLDLPFPSKYPYKFRDGCLHDISASKDYAIGGHVAAGASRMYLFSTDTQSSAVFDIEFDYNSPVTLTTADNFHIAGTYIAVRP
jgi:hypothetical protein